MTDNYAAMKTAQKVPRIFRLTPDIDAELRRRSESTGIPQTRMVEDALRFHFATNMQQQLSRKIAAFKGFTENPNRPLTSFMSNAVAV